MSLNSKKNPIPVLSALFLLLIAGNARASDAGFEFGETGASVCAQMCDPAFGPGCTNTCIEQSKAEREFRENSIYSHPERVEFQPLARKGNSVALKISSDTSNLCTQTNSSLTHALVDNSSRRIIVRFAHGERGDICPALFVEREFGVQLAVIPGLSGDYEIVSETPSTATSKGGVRSHGKVRIQD